MQTKFRSLLPAVALALAACPVGPPQVGGANITCKTTADCQPGEVCDPAYGLCIAAPAVPDAGDGGPPVCVIAGQTYDAGAYNPNQACQTCQPNLSTSAFSNLNGFPPDGGCAQAGEVCDNGSCQSGCYITNVGFEAAGALEANNPCHVCEPATSTSNWVSLTGVPADAGCGTGEVCNAGACAAGCVIPDAGYVPTGYTPSGSPCVTCDPSVSVTSYDAVFTGLPADGGCGSGKICQSGACTAGCYINGAFVAPSAANGQDGCQSCEPAKLVSNWTDATDGTACTSGGGHFCQTGQCENDCDIGGQLLSNGASDPANACESCQTANDLTNWSPAVAGAVSCNTNGGNYCVAGSCALACDIGGAVLDAGTLNTANGCQSCQPGLAVMTYSPVTDGTTCTTGGTYCVGGSCAKDCQIGGVLLTDGTLDGGNPDVCCNVGLSPTSWTSGFSVQGSTLATGTSPQGIAAGDVNGDGGIDLVVADLLTVSVFYGNGNGTFGSQVTFATGNGPNSVALPDLNANQLLDIAVANNGDGTVSVLMNQGGAGGFTPAPSSPFAVGPSPTAIAVGNFKTKTSVDLAVADLGVVGATGNEVSILLNNGSGGFGPKQGYQVGNSPSSIAMADYDGDGFGDLAVANQADGTVTVLTNNGNGTFTTQTTLNLGSGSPQPNAVVAADFNGDGKPDLAVASNVTNDVRVFLNHGGSWSTMQGPFAVGTNPTSLVAGILTSDLAVSNKTTGTVSVLINQTTPGALTAIFAMQATYPLSGGLVSIAEGQFTAEVFPDLAVVNNTQKSVSILLGQCL